VTYSFRVHPVHRTFELAEVPIHFLCPLEFAFRPQLAKDQPATVTLRLAGPATEQPPIVRAFVDLTQGPFGRGRSVEPLRVQLPGGYQLLHDPPRVAFVLEPVAGNRE
jgi:hypothetical protein